MDGTTGKLTWAPPKGVERVTGYKLQLGVDDSVPVGPEVTSYDVPNLVAGKSYYFQVTALTAEGAGYPAETTLMVPFPEVAPPAPRKTTSSSGSGNASNESTASSSGPQGTTTQAFTARGTVTLATDGDKGGGMPCDQPQGASLQLLEEHDAFEADAEIAASGKRIDDPTFVGDTAIYTCAYEFTASVSGDSSIYTIRLYRGTKLADQSKWKTGDLRSGTTPVLSA